MLTFEFFQARELGSNPPLVIWEKESKAMASFMSTTIPFCNARIESHSEASSGTHAQPTTLRQKRGKAIVHKSYLCRSYHNIDRMISSSILYHYNRFTVLSLEDGQGFRMPNWKSNVPFTQPTPFLISDWVPPWLLLTA